MADEVKLESNSNIIIKRDKNVNFYKYATLALLIVIVGVFVVIKYIPGLFSGGEVVAKVNGESITLSELNGIYESIPEQQRASVTKQEILDSLIQLKVVYQEAKKEGFSVTKEEANSELDLLIVSAGMTREQFLQNLAKQKMTEEDFVKRYIEQMTVQKLINKTVLQNIDVSNAEVSDYYLKNINQFERGEQVTVRHILIGNDTLSVSEKESKAKALLKKVNKNNFCDYVTKYSTDIASVSNCGEYTFGRDDPYVEEFKNLAFSQKEGEIGTANTEFGTHIIWTVKNLPPGTTPLIEVSGQIKEFLKAEKGKKDYDAFYQNLESKSKIKIYDDLLL